MTTLEATLTGRVPQWTLQDRLLKARHESGLTQEELASRLGIGKKSVTRYERGIVAPKRGYLLGWAIVCGVDPVWLEHGATPPGDTPTQPSSQSACNGDNVIELHPRFASAA